MNDANDSDTAKNSKPLNLNLEDPLPEQEVEENESEDEGMEDYKQGGYHPVHLGEVLLDRYVIIQKLGWGHFSTVWLSKDFKYNTYVAIKIQKSAPHYLEAAYDEVEILQKVARKANDPEWMKSLREYYPEKRNFTRDDCQVVQLLNSFIYKGPYGNHFCMVFEILGVNLLEIIKRYEYKGVPMHLCRILAKQILIGLDFLHRFCGVIHTDLKPENVLICLTQEEIKDIVENGRLSESIQFEQRIREYQKAHGIEPNPETIRIPEKKEENKMDDEEKLKNMTKNQRKNLRKKLKKKQKKKELKEKLLQNNQENDEESNDKEVSQKNLEQNNTKNENELEKEEKQHGVHHQPNIMENYYKTRGPKLNENLRVKIADLGNACWTHHHFATEIQTRQYRSPEVIIGIKYNESADIWSFASMIFEMLTGDFLFEPRKGPNFGKDDDHLAQVQEIIKKLPKKFALSGKNSRKYFQSNGDLKRIPNLHFWPLKYVLKEKYHIKEKEANMFESFLLPMLEFYPSLRATARECLSHGWLQMPPDLNYKMTEQETEIYFKKKQLLAGTSEEPENLSQQASDSELNDGDLEDNSEPTSNDVSDNEFYGDANILINKKWIDRSFTNLGYLGYGDGLNLEELDQNANWQFEGLK